MSEGLHGKFSVARKIVRGREGKKQALSCSNREITES